MSYREDDFSEYFEPNKADLIYLEAMEKLKDAMLSDIKDKINNLEKENEILKEENQKCRRREKEISQKEQELFDRTKDLDGNFYRKKFSDIVKPLVEHFEGYCVNQGSRLIDKCDECDDDRYVVYLSASGKQLKQICSCHRFIHEYQPMRTTVETVDFLKDQYKTPKFTMIPRYHSNVRDDYNGFSLTFKEIIDYFDESKVNQLNFEHMLFKSEEECQKCCDWLNSYTAEKTK